MEELFKKIVNKEFINRNDEKMLYDIIVRLFGEGNVLTEIEIEDHKTIYFGCAIRKDGKWIVYNLVGDKDGVVVKIGKCFHLLTREN